MRFLSAALKAPHEEPADPLSALHARSCAQLWLPKTVAQQEQLVPVQSQSASPPDTGQVARAARRSGANLLWSSTRKAGGRDLPPAFRCPPEKTKPETSYKQINSDTRVLLNDCL